MGDLCFLSRCIIVPYRFFLHCAFLSAGVIWMVFVACNPVDEPMRTPVIVTSVVSGIEVESAWSGGSVVSDGGEIITAKGVCWSTAPEPDLNSDYTTDGIGANTFASMLCCLEPNTVYHVRAYAENSHGVGYGNELTFKTPPAFIQDIDGRTYRIKTYGDQIWMIDNLAVTRLNDGTAITKILSNTAWFHSKEPAFCYFNKDEGYHKETYGALYNWEAVRGNKLCPAGWRVPSDVDWMGLESFLGMDSHELHFSDWRGNNQNTGGAMKDSTLWLSPNTGGNNSSGFHAIPSGYRDHTGSFWDAGSYARYWSTTETDSVLAMTRRLHHLRNSVYRGQALKRHGYAVRCVKDRS